MKEITNSALKKQANKLIFFYSIPAQLISRHTSLGFERRNSIGENFTDSLMLITIKNLSLFIPSKERIV